MKKSFKWIHIFFEQKKSFSNFHLKLLVSRINKHLKNHWLYNLYIPPYFRTSKECTEMDVTCIPDWWSEMQALPIPMKSSELQRALARLKNNKTSPKFKYLNLSKQIFSLKLWINERSGKTKQSNIHFNWSSKLIFKGNLRRLKSALTNVPNKCFQIKL